MSRKSIIVLSFLLILSVILTSCGSTSETDSPGGKNDIVFVFDGEPNTLDAAQTTNQNEYTVIYQVHDYLIDKLPDGSYEKGLAEEWTYSDDRTEITFTIKEGVKFHNGDDLTAEDVAFSLNNAIASPQTSRITGAMDSASVVGDNQVTLKLKHPFSPIEYCLANPQLGILNKKAYEADPEGYARHPIGSGAYEFVGWKSGDEITLTAFEDYHGDPAPIKDITFKIMLDKDTALIALENGEVDYVFDIAKTGIQQVKDSSNLEYYSANAASTCFIMINNEDEVLSNKLVRQALAHAVDRDALIAGAVEGYGVPQHTPISMSAFGFPEGFENREYDIEKAKELLAEAGYADGLDLTFIGTETLNFLRPGEILQSQFAEIGVNLDIDKMDFSVWGDRTAAGDYQLAVVEMSTAYPDADHMYALYHSTMIDGGRNNIRVSNQELDELLDAGRVSADEDERLEIYEEIAELFKEEVFTIPTYSLETDVAAHKDLKGIVAHSPSVYKIYYYSWAE